MGGGYTAVVQAELALIDVLAAAPDFVEEMAGTAAVATHGTSFNVDAAKALLNARNSFQHRHIGAVNP